MNNRIRLARGTSDKRKASDLEIVPGQLFFETDTNLLYSTTNNKNTPLKNATSIYNKNFIVSLDKPIHQDNFDMWASFNSIIDSFIGDWIGETVVSSTRTDFIKFKYNNAGQVYFNISWNGYYGHTILVDDSNPPIYFKTETNKLIFHFKFTHPQTTLTYYGRLTLSSVSDNESINALYEYDNPINGWESILNLNLLKQEEDIEGDFANLDYSKPVALMYKYNEDYVNYVPELATNVVNAIRNNDGENKSLTLNKNILNINNAPLTNYDYDTTNIPYTTLLYTLDSRDGNYTPATFSDNLYIKLGQYESLNIELMIRSTYTSNGESFTSTHKLSFDNINTSTFSSSSVLIHSYNEGNQLISYIFTCRLYDYDSATGTYRIDFGHDAGTLIWKNTSASSDYTNTISIDSS